MAVYENSRYLHTRQSNRLGWDTPTLEIRQRFTFNQEDCTMHEWCEGDTLDGVAFRYYGICALRWAILDANPKYRTEFDIKNGEVILIPDYEEVVSLVNV
jgi:phage tail protein X